MDHIQSIEWKEDNKPPETEKLYFYGENISLKDDHIEMAPGGMIDFETYSNIFNGKKWFKYTVLENLSLNLQIEGHFLLQVSADKNLFFNKEIICKGKYGLDIPEEFHHGIISFKIQAIKATKFYSGTWSTSIDKDRLNCVKIALVMCTFNRDEYLFRNLSILKDSLPSCYSLFVVDNGNRIEKESVESISDRFKLFHNNNTGGSGGFTRGLIEAVRDREEWTHVHFMDDDVTIETESLKRTASFLSLVKEEYKDCFMSGAMLRMDTPWVLHESTASWSGIKLKSNNKGMDLRDRDNIYLNEKEPDLANPYAAWWYCVIPLGEGIENDLPFPFFINGDDIEYSIRRAGGIIALNGVCVWHEPFDRKYSPVQLHYFASRNAMILNTLNAEKFGFFKTCISIQARAIVQLCVHDYKSTDLVLDAFVDYLMGPAFAMNCDNAAIMVKKRDDPAQPVSLTEEEMALYYPIQLHYKKQNAFYYFFKKRIAVLDSGMNCRELRTRSLSELFRLSGRLLKLSCLMLFKYGQIRRAYRNISLDISLWDEKNTPAHSESRVN